MNQLLPEFLCPVFWEYDPSTLDFTQHKGFIIERILEKGKFDSVKWLFKIYTLQEIKNVIESSINLTKNTQEFWKLFFTYEAQTA